MAKVQRLGYLFVLGEDHQPDEQVQRADKGGIDLKPEAAGLRLEVAQLGLPETEAEAEGVVAFDEVDDIAADMNVFIQVILDMPFLGDGQGFRRVLGVRPDDDRPEHIPG